MCAIMLAHNGLALITEKLQKQRLEEFPPIISGNHLSQVTTNRTAAASKQQSHLAAKGKNVWTLSIETERHQRQELGTQDMCKPSPLSTGRIQQSYPTFCRHENPPHVCEFCEYASGAPAAPPKKKRCRSLSGPPECLTVGPAPIVEYTCKLWKPIAVMPPQCSNNIAATRSCESSNWLPNKTTGFKLLPVISSRRNADSGCCATSIQTSLSGCCTNSTQTSSGSPIPRPASATSNTSFNSIWQDCSPKESRVRVLGNRSLSCEGQISGSSSNNVTASDSQEISHSCNRSDIPRCHSQPCIPHHRRCGKKRRRDFQRPTLNFHKMTETAYIHAHVPIQAELWDISLRKQQVCGSIPQVFTDGCADAVFKLSPNASSSLDSGLPALPKHFNADLNNPASIALPTTPPMNASPNFPHEEDNEQYGSHVEAEEACVHFRDCCCHNSRLNARGGLFPMVDLDIVEIESH